MLTNSKAAVLAGAMAAVLATAGDVKAQNTITIEDATVTQVTRGVPPFTYIRYIYAAKVDYRPPVGATVTEVTVQAFQKLVGADGTITKGVAYSSPKTLKSTDNPATININGGVTWISMAESQYGPNAVIVATVKYSDGTSKTSTPLKEPSIVQ